ncbi:MAG: 50S ribosomal protein L24 [Spirochaetes bacterium]|nr:50S ribosomal protein L24 [Spirochaetota bacterium]
MLKYKKLKKGDSVKVVSGKDLGKQGRILEVNRDKGRVLVEGVNIVKKTMRKSQENPHGGIKDVEAFLDISNVQLICPKCKKSTRIAIKEADDKKVRICKKCNAEVE